MRVRFGSREITVPASCTSVGALKRFLASSAGAQLAVERQGLTFTPAAGGAQRLDDDGAALPSAAGELALKDYGAQISYRAVFLIEYAGPLAIVAAYAARPSLIYGAGAAAAPWSPVALAGLLAWLAHFAKREAETLFVHRFSRPTMPLGNLFKNCLYYWLFALFIGYPLAHPAFTAPASAAQVALGGALMAAAELVNLLVHLQLSAMRPGGDGSKERRAPGGPLFALVSTPNYTSEVLCWVGYSLMTQIGAAYVFTLLGFLQMTQWALAKHRAYIKADPAYRKLGRAAIVPFLL